MLRKVQSIVLFLLKKSIREQELDSELRYHIERQTEENIRRGMTPQDARRVALRTIGGIEQIKEECRDARLGRSVEATLQDVRYGLRVLLKNPGFTSTAIITLALGIGVNTAVFSVVYGILLRPLPYWKPGQLVVLHQIAPRAHAGDIPFSVHEISDYRDRSHTLEAVVEHHNMFFLLLGKGWAERVQTAVVSANFFDVLGVKPLLGRTFVPRDETKGADAVLILSNKYWQTRFGGDPNIVGKVFQMNSRPNTVIGVLPPIPQYPSESDMYMPTSQCPFRSDPKFIANRNQRMMTAFGRLKPGVSLEKAQADLSAIAGRLANQYPESYPKVYGYGISAAPLRDDLTRRARSTFLVLLGASGFVLLIACANVANLLLARLLTLERELAVRTALGATRARLTRQLLTESVLVSVTGGALGLFAAPPAVALLVKFAARFTTRSAEVKIDTPVLLFTLAISIATGILFGFAPAFSSSRHIADALKQGLPHATATRSRQRFRGALVIAQVAVSFMLLMGAGLMIRSFVKLEQVNPGFKPDRLLTMRLSPNFARYLGNQFAFVTLCRNILRQVNAISGLQSAALATTFPFDPAGIGTDPDSVGIHIEGKPTSKRELPPRAAVALVSAGYFETLRQPVLEGRAFTEHDLIAQPQSAIVNYSFAHHRSPNENPIGKRISFEETGPKRWITVVGVVGDVKEYGLSRPPDDEIYLPGYSFKTHLIVRTAMDPMTAAPLIRSVIHRLDPQLAIDEVDTIENFEQDSVASPRLTALLLGIFALLAVVISASGIAAVMALSVTQRTHELGIRMALGAKRFGILRMMLHRGLGLTAIGTVVGILGALLLTRLLSSLLYATSPTDAWTFLAVSALFFPVAGLACFIPAHQVTSIDPLVALRQE